MVMMSYCKVQGMTVATSLLPGTVPPESDSEVLDIIERLPGADQELAPVYRAAVCHRNGQPYRIVLLYSMSDVLHFATEMSHHGFNFESTPQAGAGGHEGTFWKD